MKAALPSLLAVAIALLAGCVSPDDGPRESPYADHIGNEVRGLKQAEIDGLRNGGGMGFALAAEANGWPGPLHALELSAELALSAAQEEALRAMRASMLEQAVPLGEEVLAAHKRLEDAFRSGNMTEERLREDVAALEGLYAELRFVHLRTHIEAYDVFTPHQRMEYMRLRGYADESGGHGDHAGH
jgi:hypothetical protein